MRVPRPLAARFDARADAQRRRSALWLRAIFEWQWERDGEELGGPAGALVSLEIERRMQAGPAAIPVYDKNKQIVGHRGDGFRWRIAKAVADLGRPHLRDMATELQLLRPPAVSGDVAGYAWDWLQERADYGRGFLARQLLMLGVGAVVMRPVLEEYRDGAYYPAGMVEVPPDRCFALADPTGRAAVIGVNLDDDDPLVVTTMGQRWAEEGWAVWDFSDPEEPVWGVWENPEEWQRWERPSDLAIRSLTPGAHLGRCGPRWAMVGAAYPWKWQTRPILPAVCQQRSATTRELLPNATSEGQSVLDLIFAETWVGYVQQLSSFNRAYLLSEHEITGMAQVLAEPNGLANLYGPGAYAQFATVQHAMDAVRSLRDIHQERVLAWYRRYDPNFQVQKLDAEAGVALRIRNGARDRLRLQQIDAARPIDEACNRALIATHNYLAASGQYASHLDNPGPIPEGAIEIRYPRLLDSLEAEEEIKRIRERIDRGEDFPERTWLLEQGIDGAERGSESWRAATEYIDAALAEAGRRAAQGYGLRWQDRYAITQATLGDETETYIPPADVADTAARGLALRDEKGRGLDGMTPNGKRLLRRAKALREQTPMTMGEVRALNTWLRQHQDDGGQEAEEGVWGNDADPSAAWVEYLSQGGDPGLDWTGLVLAGGQTTPADTGREAVA